MSCLNRLELVGLDGVCRMIKLNISMASNIGISMILKFMNKKILIALSKIFAV